MEPQSAAILSAATGNTAQLEHTTLALDESYREVEASYRTATPANRQSPYLDSSIKRVLDVLSSAFALVLLGIFAFPLIALLIKLDSPGPVLYIQTRYGKNGQVFRCFKFRTMTHSADSQRFVQAQKNDVRVTKVGAKLRATNLDELPQLFNVLKGDMSLIGPRPHPVDLDNKFVRTIPDLMSRYQAKPGLSGLAQVSGQRGETRSSRDMRNRLRFDYLYIQRASVLLDLRIVVQTVVKMLLGDEKAF